MKVTIDGVEYIKAPLKCEAKNVEAALALRFYCDDIGEEISIKDYLQELLSTLWEQKDSFSGKRPFGNSGWESNILYALADNGFLGEKVDREKRMLTDEEWKKYNQYVSDLIIAIFHK